MSCIMKSHTQRTLWRENSRDAEALEPVKNKFVKWERDTSGWKNKPVALNKESIAAVDCHVFGDTSIVAGCTVAFAVVDQPSDSYLRFLQSWTKYLEQNGVIQ